jgi:LPS-assembly lipoprotein
MWSRDRTSRARGTAILLALAIAGVVAGCQVRPLYAVRADGAGGDVVPQMRRIAVETQRDRVAQEIMNQLIFSLRGGAALVDPAYTLRLIVATRKSELAIQVREEVPTANLITVTTTYSLTENATGRVLASETIYTTASYDFSSQRFANLRAERDAENRAARAAADDIRMRIAAMFAAAPTAGP